MSASPAEPPCECPGPGLCPRYGIVQGEHHIELCRTSPAYRRKWRLTAGTPAAAVTNRVPLAVKPTPPAPWPWFARLIAKGRNETDKGLGDTVARVFARFGSERLVKIYKRLVGKDCGCGSRQQKLNARFPYR